MPVLDENVLLFWKLNTLKLDAIVGERNGSDDESWRRITNIRHVILQQW